MKHFAMGTKKCLFVLLLFLFFPLFAEEKIDHQYDVWYQLVCIPTDSDSEPYTFEWFWRNPKWRNVIGFVQPQDMVDGKFKTSDFQFLNLSSRMGLEVKEAIYIFENDLLVADTSRKAVGTTFFVKGKGVVWQPDETFLLALYRLTVNPESENDSNYSWW